jgi:Na+/melibiose symporter-like transporter
MVRVGTILGLFFFPPLMAKIGLAKLMLALVLVPCAGLLSLWAIKWEPIGSNIEGTVESATSITALARQAS